MIGTFEALLVVIVALLPGASYTWAFELQAGRRDAPPRPGFATSLVDVDFATRVRACALADRRIYGSRGPTTSWMGQIPHGLLASPRAWDHVFTSPALNGWLLLKMKDSSWIAGYWGAEDDRGAALNSYASGYPESQELYFSDTAVVDGDGAVTVDESGRPKPTGLGVLVRWDEVAYAYFGEG